MDKKCQVHVFLFFLKEYDIKVYILMYQCLIVILINIWCLCKELQYMFDLSEYFECSFSDPIWEVISSVFKDILRNYNSNS